MANRTLYIIGNGFDRFHHMESGYEHFKVYVEKHDAALAEILSEYFSYKMLWSNFEAELANLDTDAIEENFSDLLIGPGSDDWKESANHDYEFEINEVVEALTVRLKSLFTDWVLEIKIPQNQPFLLPIDKSAKFINFNYTSTLEQIYKIPEANILYIHNKAVNKDSLLILGHGVTPQPINREPPRRITYREDMTDEEREDYEQQEEDARDAMADQDIRVIGGLELINSYFVKTYKQTRAVIASNSKFFQSLRDVDEVIVLGHSISPVDILYFREIEENVRKNDFMWNVDYYSEKSIQDKEEALLSIGIERSRIKFFKTTDLR